MNCVKESKLKKALSGPSLFVNFLITYSLVHASIEAYKLITDPPHIRQIQNYTRMFEESTKDTIMYQSQGSAQEYITPNGSSVPIQDTLTEKLYK
jgi:hypothetical protein